MSHKSHGNPVATYIITALILGVITYLEFALVEYDVAWLSRGWTIFWLIALSVVKFVMVVAIFMHLKDDEKTYTGFFGSGLLIALVTFLILPLLFTVRALPGQGSPIAAEITQEFALERGGGHEAEAEAEAAAGHGLSAADRAIIDSGGYSRARSRILDSPPPADRSLVIKPPGAAKARASLRTGDAAEPVEAAEGAEQAEQADDAEQAREAEAADGAEQAAGDEQALAQAEQPTTEQPAAEQPAAEQPATEEEGAEQEAAQPTDFDRELGADIYAGNCQSCHQADGTGIPGVFPPLAGNLPDLVNAEGGRQYLIDVLLHGLSGQIEVNGQTYNGVMPPWANLSDEQIAAVLNHELTSWGNDQALQEFTPIAADEVAERRGEQAGNLNERRTQLQTQ
jgi:mono/diheme cytochrome c family protein/heme/copper-type cytochrome/quinol oxidase subunit 4